MQYVLEACFFQFGEYVEMRKRIADGYFPSQEELMLAEIGADSDEDAIEAAKQTLNYSEKKPIFGFLSNSAERKEIGVFFHPEFSDLGVPNDAERDKYPTLKQLRIEPYC